MFALIPVALILAAADPPSVPASPSPGQIRHDQAVEAAKVNPKPYYPDRAKRLGMSGKAVLDCSVDPDGWLDDCKVASEDPPDFGFGATALEMAPYFRLKPRADGARTADKPRTRFPVQFKLP